MPKNYKVKSGKRGIRIARRKPTRTELAALIDSILINATVLKMKLKYLLPIILAAMTLAGYAQVPSEVSNATIGLAAERFGLSLGASSEFGSGDPRAVMALDYSFRANTNSNIGWFLRAEAQTGSDQVVRSIEAGGGIYKLAAQNVRIYGLGLLGHDWQRTRFDFSAGAGAAWQPFTGDVLQKVSMGAESLVVIGLTHPAQQAPNWVNRIYVRYSF